MSGERREGEAGTGAGPGAGPPARASRGTPNPDPTGEDASVERRMEAEDALHRARARSTSWRNLSLFWTGIATMYFTWGVMGEGTPAWTLFAVLAVIAAVSWGRFRTRRREEAEASRRVRELDAPEPAPGPEER